MFSQNLFSVDRPILGVIHLKALPGAPMYNGDLEALYDHAIMEAKLFNKYLDGIILENFNDQPFYPGSVPPETIAAMSSLAREVCKATSVPIGINVLRNDAHAALAIASVVDAQFIRVNVHQHAVVADQGIIQGLAHETLRVRAALKSTVQIFADVKVKHANPLGNRSLAEEVGDISGRGMVDALIVSGKHTGGATNPEELKTVRENSELPILIGSGTNPDNYPLLKEANGFIVGSYFKEEGKVKNPLSESRLKSFMKDIGR